MAWIQGRFVAVAAYPETECEGMRKDRMPGFWVLTIGLILMIVATPVVQTTTLLNYDLAIGMGVAEPRGAIPPMGIAFIRGFAAADTFVLWPLMILSVIGLFARAPWGLIPVSAFLGSTAYWPLVLGVATYLGAEVPGWEVPLLGAWGIVFAAHLAFAIWGLWYVWTNRGHLFDIR